MRKTSLPSASQLAQGLVEREPFLARVVAVTVGMYCYEIQSGAGICEIATATSTSVGGVRDCSMYAAGDLVLAVRVPQLPYPIIVCAVPRVSVDNRVDADPLVMSGAAGLLDTPLQLQLARRPGMMRNFGVQRPYDVFPGEWGMRSPFGVGMHVADLQASMCASDVAGVWCYYPGSVVRFNAYRLREMTAMGERRVEDTNSELLDAEMVHAYPWEGLGSPRQTVSPLIREERAYDLAQPDPSFKPGQTPDKAEVRLVNQAQRPIPRITTLSGYAAALRTTYVTAATQTSLYTGQPGYLAALSSDHTGADGRREIRSATGIYLIKEACIPYPVRVVPEEEPGGNTLEDYKFAGVFGEGEEIDLTKPETSVLQLPDEMARYHQVEALGAFKLRGKDWRVDRPSEGLDTDLFSVSTDYSSRVPRAWEIEIDGRKGNTRKIYLSRAVIGITDTGDITIESATGSQISMIGEDIHISAARDVRIIAGRNFHVQAANDVSVAAGHSSEVTAATGDLRMQSARVTAVAGGTSGTGGVLVTSNGAGRSVDFRGVGEDVQVAGIVMRASDGPVVTYGTSIYTRATAGDVYVDAGRGAVWNFCESQTNFVRSFATTLFGAQPDGGGQVRAQILADAQTVTFTQPQSFIVRSSALVMDGGGAQLLLNGTLSAKTLQATSTDVQPLRASDFSREFSSSIRRLDASLTGNRTALLAQPTSSGLAPYGDGGVGLDDVWRDIGFSFRTTQQYGTANLELPEARWQQMARFTGQDLPAIHIPIIEGKDGGTMPWPGREAWAAPSLLQADPSNLDEQLLEKEELAHYKQELPAPQRVSLLKGFTVKQQRLS